MVKLGVQDRRIFGTTSDNVKLPVKVTDDGSSKGLVNVTLISSFPSSVYVRNTEYGTDNYPNLYFNILNLFDVPACVIADPVNLAVAAVTALSGTIGHLNIGGNAAHDAAYGAQYPLPMGAYASTALPTAVSTDGDLVRIWASTRGAVNIIPRHTDNTVLSYKAGETVIAGTAIGGDSTTGFVPIWLVKIGDATSATLNYFLNASATLGFNGTTFDRIRALGNNNDGLSAVTLGVMSTNANMMSWDPSGSRWNRVRGDTTGGNWVQGAIASDSPDSGGPLKIGYIGKTSHITAVSNNDRVNAVGNTRGFGGVMLMAEPAGPYTVTTTGAQTAIDATMNPYKYYSIQVKGTGGAATTWSVELQVSNDNTNWTVLITHANADGDGTTKTHASFFPARYFRVNTATLTLGGATNIIVRAVATQ